MKQIPKLVLGVLIAGLALTACNKKEPAQQVKPNGLPKAGAQAAKTMEVAIVDIDSLATQYTYCKDGLKALEAKQANYRQQLNNKAQALQNAVMAFQKKAQSGGFTSQQEAENAQAALQKQQQALQQFHERIENEMANATKQYQKVLRDSLNSYLRDYNKDQRYKLILSKSGDNVLYAVPTVLYAAPTADITADVIAGLNKRYKK